ncbi:hypothetical protein [Bacillus sp. JJ722]|uniref:hypothetical protein n=1 Tax=Bacillus sp. JJ722 TaxID=3122973 RepID=UPI002FFEE08A
MEMFLILVILLIIGVTLSKLLFAGKSVASKNNSLDHTSTNQHYYGIESFDDGRHNDHHHHGVNCDNGSGSDCGGGDSGGSF